jgi:hypothetical protein
MAPGPKGDYPEVAAAENYPALVGSNCGLVIKEMLPGYSLMTTD